VGYLARMWVRIGRKTKFFVGKRVQKRPRHSWVGVDGIQVTQDKDFAGFF
jgi:hypothetical protein